LKEALLLIEEAFSLPGSKISPKPKNYFFVLLFLKFSSSCDFTPGKLIRKFSLNFD